MESTNHDNNVGTWGTLIGAVGGAAAGYWAGRSSGPYNYGFGYGNAPFVNPGFAPIAYPVNVGNHCVDGGFNSFEAGKTQAQLTAGLDYTAQGIAAARNDICNLGSQMNAGFQRIEDRQFQMLVSENQALKSELYTTNALGPVKAELAGIGCAVSCLKSNQVSAFKAVPLCTTCPTATTTTA